MEVKMMLKTFFCLLREFLWIFRTQTMKNFLLYLILSISQFIIWIRAQKSVSFIKIRCYQSSSWNHSVAISKSGSVCSWCTHIKFIPSKFSLSFMRHIFIICFLMKKNCLTLYSPSRAQPHVQSRNTLRLRLYVRDYRPERFEIEYFCLNILDHGR